MTQFDKIDQRILDILQKEGRVTNRELAVRVGLSAAPCWHRVKRLEQTGIIDHYACVLASNKVGRHVTAIAGVTLITRSKEAREVFETAIAELPEVLSCFWVAADFDYQLIISSTDLMGFQHFLDTQLLTLPSVANVKSQMALKIVKNTTTVPLDGIMEDDDMESLAGNQIQSFSA